MSQSQKPQTQVGESSGMNRRAFMRRGAAGSLAVAGVSYGSLRLDAGPVGNAKANPALLGLGGAAAVGWLIADSDPLDLFSSPTGLSRPEYRRQFAETIIRRDNRIRSVYANNQNILYGSTDIAFTQAQAAAIEELNNGESQEVAQEEGEKEINKQWSTVLKNFLREYDETVNEMSVWLVNADEYDVNAVDWDDSESGSIEVNGVTIPNDEGLINNNGLRAIDDGIATETYLLPNGEEFEYSAINWEPQNIIIN